MSGRLRPAGPDVGCSVDHHPTPNRTSIPKGGNRMKKIQAVKVEKLKLTGKCGTTKC
jgi:hypothetical protein